MMYQGEFLRGLVFVIAAAMMMASNAFSQVIGDSETIVIAASGVTGFEALSPGNRKITQSLHDAQNAEDGGGSLSLDDIAGLKQQGDGWGDIFKQMKEEGLISEKNLGQIVSAKGMTDAGFGRAKVAQEITEGSALRSPDATASSGRLMRYRRPSLVVTTANGRRVVVGLKKPGLRSILKNGERTTRGSFRQKAQRSTLGSTLGSTVTGRVRRARVFSSASAGNFSAVSSATRSHGGNRGGKKN